ncbi:hypothetical protein J6590_059366 [Homalodisca vitripennis]|nr:hypothetical protein J6590_093156 [Homalodisca vitripennis]KAG8335830.1 hypothetical protein J6590_059366 [Homalodisca vitripennis]
MGRQSYTAAGRGKLRKSLKEEIVQLKESVRESQELVNIYCSVNGGRPATSYILTTNPTIRDWP